MKSELAKLMLGCTSSLLKKNNDEKSTLHKLCPLFRNMMYYFSRFKNPIEKVLHECYIHQSMRLVKFKIILIDESKQRKKKSVKFI